MVEKEELTAHIALGIMRGADVRMVQRMMEVGMTADEFFSVNTLTLSDRLGIDSRRFITDSERNAALSSAKREVSFVSRHGIKVYSLLDDDYPMLLSHISDPPKILFQLGEADLNGEHIVSLVGTRRCTGYGADFVDKFVDDIGTYFPDVKVVSGLAHGIDSFAHKASLGKNLSTLAVVAHGLHMIYPAQNRELAKRILKAGGAILSEYPSGETPFAARFLERNRIIAGLSHLTIVVESEIKGGAMSTANYAFNYSREVGAVPGRISDSISAGCNHLIRKQKASLVGTAADVIELMDWRPLGRKVDSRQRNLFPEITGVSGRIYELIKKSTEPVSVDYIKMTLNLNISEVMSALTDLEFDGIVSRRPGNRYEIS